MRTYVATNLPCNADQAWENVQTSALLMEVTRPLVVIRPVAGGDLPQRWSEKATVHCRPYLGGFIPLGTRTIFFERLEQNAREIQSREHDCLIRRWDHLVRIEPIDGESCRYSDEIEIEAGLLTFFVWLFACCFYRFRQHRWKAVARRVAASAGAASAGNDSENLAAVPQPAAGAAG